MSAFPDTPTTLLTRLAANVTGEDESNWAKFFELYQPALVAFAERRMPDGWSDAEDVAQEVLARLVAVLREGRYDKSRGPFRRYLAAMMRNRLLSLYRHEAARPDCDARPLGRDGESEAALAVSPVVEARLDAEWAAARHRAAVNHILGNSALSAQSKAIFRELEASGDTSAAVAKRFGVPATTVRQVKSRVSRMVAALEKRMKA